MKRRAICCVLFAASLALVGCGADPLAGTYEGTWTMSSVFELSVQCSMALEDGNDDSLSLLSPDCGGVHGPGVSMDVQMKPAGDSASVFKNDPQLVDIQALDAQHLLAGQRDWTLTVNEGLKGSRGIAEVSGREITIDLSGSLSTDTHAVSHADMTFAGTRVGK